MGLPDFCVQNPLCPPAVRPRGSLSRPYEGCLIMGGIRFSSGKEAGQSAMADKFHVSTSAPNRPCSCDVRIILYSLFRCLQTAPASLGVAQYRWLVAGTTMLGDELSLLHRPEQIASSVFASILTSTWNGTAFGP